MPWPKGIPFPKEATAKRIATLQRNGTRRRKPVVIDGVPHWICSTCKHTKPAREYHADDRRPNGLKSQCKRCHSETSIRTRDPDLHRKSKRRHEASRRASKARVGCWPLSESSLAALARIQGSRCLECAKSHDLQWDHIVPLAKGGCHALWNLQLLCRKCNEIKQARTADNRTPRMKLYAALTFRVHQQNVDHFIKGKEAA
jgi:5-methylcytosine-specific restriction endonuclease McrA